MRLGEDLHARTISYTSSWLTSAINQRTALPQRPAHTMPVILAHSESKERRKEEKTQRRKEQEEMCSSPPLPLPRPFFGLSLSLSLSLPSIIIHEDTVENEVTRMYTLPARDSSTPPTLRRRQEINEDLAGSVGHCAETLHEYLRGAG